MRAGGPLHLGDGAGLHQCGLLVPSLMYQGPAYYVADDQGLATPATSNVDDEAEDDVDSPEHQPHQGVVHLHISGGLILNHSIQYGLNCHDCACFPYGEKSERKIVISV